MCLERRHTSAAATNTADSDGALQVTRERTSRSNFRGGQAGRHLQPERPQAPGVPFFVVPKFAGGFSNHTFDINARQSLLGVLFTGPKIGASSPRGGYRRCFSTPPSWQTVMGFCSNNRTASCSTIVEVRRGSAIRRLRSRLADGSALFLLRWLGPTGNCIRGQIRVERFFGIGGDSQLTLQGAVSEPLNTAVTPDISLDEDNGWPNVEGRMGFGLGKPAPIGSLTQRPMEFGFSGSGQLRRTAPPDDPPRRVVSDVGSRRRRSSELGKPLRIQG